jgi:hypothetical protein
MGPATTPNQHTKVLFFIRGLSAAGVRCGISGDDNRFYRGKNYFGCHGPTWWA